MGVIEFFSSQIGVTIAWICTVLSFIFGVFKTIENRKLKLEINQFKNKNQVDNLTSEVADLSSDDVIQNGEKNIYTKNNSGGMSIHM